MLNRVWAHPEDKNTWKTKVEEHVYRDRVTEEEVFDYSFRDRFGRTFNVKDWNEAKNLIEHYNLVDITEKMVDAGWISRTQYETFRRQEKQI